MGSLDYTSIMYQLQGNHQNATIGLKLLNS